MKMNLRVRMKNPWFWVGVGSIILAALGVEPAMFTSWATVGQYFVDMLTNPFQLFTVVFAVLAVFVDPTTAGFNDSNQAMGYQSPKKDN